MTDERDTAKSSGINGQRHGRILRYIASLYVCWLELVARLIRGFLPSLQSTPIAPLLRYGCRSYPPELARKSYVRSTIHGKHINVVILDMVAARLGYGERAVHTTAMLADIPEYSAWTSSGETDDDGK